MSGLTSDETVLAGLSGVQRFAPDSPLERTGFELAVPLRWTALRSEVVEEAFGSARYDERGRPQRPAVSACATP